MTFQKTNGVYYTPEKLADFMSCHVAAHFSKPIRALEPSYGSGVFVKALFEKPDLQIKEIVGVELFPDKHKLVNLSQRRSCFKKINGDFLFMYQKLKDSFDLVIGNPPYIHQGTLSNKQRRQMNDIFDYWGLKRRSSRNSWAGFLLAAITLLSDDGVLSFVLPAEFLQVDYAQEIREILKTEFERLELVHFETLLFDGILQDAIVLNAFNKHQEKGIFECTVNSLDSLESISFSEKTDINLASRNKWSATGLSPEEVASLHSELSGHSSIQTVANLSVGLVTGANNFFILDSTTVQEKNIERYSKPIIKSGNFPAGLKLSSSTFESYDKKKFFLDFRKPLNEYARLYLQEGIKQGIHEKYKCRNRDTWYLYNIVEPYEVIFFRRIHQLPKVTLNSASLHHTDVGYRISPNVDSEKFVSIFYNTLTLISLEVMGRFYGGGVLELTPNELRSVAIPDLRRSIYSDYRSALSYSKEQLIEKNDSYLQKKLGWSDSHLDNLKKALEKLRKRRIKT